MATRARALAAGLIVVTTVVAGCAHRTVPGRTVYKTVIATPTPTTPTPTPSTPPPSSSAAPSPSHTAPPPPRYTHLVARCYSDLRGASIEQAIHTKLRGTTAYTVGRGDPTIGRLMYINCKYGVTPAKGPSVEITVSLYRSVAAAAERVQGTIQDFTSHGATSSGTTVNSRAATLLLGANMLAYGPTLVFHAGLRTVAVTLRPDTENPTPMLKQVASLAGRRTIQLS